MESVIKTSGWKSIPLGPWDRFRRELDGSRKVIVARGMYDGWTWDLWSPGDEPACLAMPMGEFETADEAKADADRVAAEVAATTDDDLARKLAVDAFAAPLTLKVVSVTGDDWQCVMCRRVLTEETAAEETAGAAWRWCPSCATRNPGSTLVTAD